MAFLVKLLFEGYLCQLFVKLIPQGSWNPKFRDISPRKWVIDILRFQETLNLLLLFSDQSEVVDTPNMRKFTGVQLFEHGFQCAECWNLEVHVVEKRKLF